MTNFLLSIDDLRMNETSIFLQKSVEIKMFLNEAFLLTSVCLYTHVSCIYMHMTVKRNPINMIVLMCFICFCISTCSKTDELHPIRIQTYFKQGEMSSINIRPFRGPLLLHCGLPNSKLFAVHNFNFILLYAVHIRCYSPYTTKFIFQPNICILTRFLG